MHYIALDTNTWIYLANGIEPVRLLEFILDESKRENIKVVVPQTVIDEWHKNKEFAVKKGALKHFKSIIEDLDRFVKLLGSKAEKDILSFILGNENEEKDYFKDLTEKLKLKKQEVDNAVNENIKAIDTFFQSPYVISLPITTGIYLKAGQFALEKKAPFQLRNSFADALIVFSFLDYIETNAIENSMFISYNVEDFCEKKPNGKRVLHSDLVPEFEKSKSVFYRYVGEALNTIKEDIVSKEELELIKEMQEQSTDNEYADVNCRLCRRVSNKYSPVYFDKAPLQDERISDEIDLNQIKLFSDPTLNEMLSNRDDEIFVGHCDYCNAEHYFCVNCNSVNLIGDHEYGRITYCEDCNQPYSFEAERDRKGVHENTTYTILSNNGQCERCGIDCVISEDNSQLCNSCAMGL